MAAFFFLIHDNDKVNGAPHVVTDTTLSRVATRPNAPVATMANREPKHPRKPAKEPEVSGGSEEREGESVC